jgi:hypothetical protein
MPFDPPLNAEERLAYEVREKCDSIAPDGQRVERALRVEPNQPDGSDGDVFVELHGCGHPRTVSEPFATVSDDLVGRAASILGADVWASQGARAGHVPGLVGPLDGR